MRLHLAIFALTLLAGFSAQADSGRLPNRGEIVPIAELATLTQKEGETEEQFMIRAGNWGHNYTTGTNHEICANICVAPGGQRSMRIFTNSSHLACAIMDKCAEGATATKETFHTHPVDERFTINDADRSFLRDRSGSANSVKRHEAFGAEGRDFSGQDYNNGAGYVVAKGKLLYQHGRGTSRVLATYADPTP